MLCRVPGGVVRTLSICSGISLPASYQQIVYRFSFVKRIATRSDLSKNHYFFLLDLFRPNLCWKAAFATGAHCEGGLWFMNNKQRVQLLLSDFGSQNVPNWA